MSIEYIKEKKVFILNTKKSSYQIKVDETGALRHLYYGRPVGSSDMDYRYKKTDRGFSGNPYEQAADRGCSFDTMPLEYSGFGVGDYRVSPLKVRLKNGSRSVDPRYVSHKMYKGKYILEGLPYVRENDSKAESLEVRLKDETAGLSFILSYGVFEEFNVITRTVKIVNDSDENVELEKASSMCIDMPFGNYDLIHFSGRHCMERRPERDILSQETITLSSKRGMSSHHSNPFVILCDRNANEDNGDCYGFMLMYSGNHKEEIEKDQTGSVRVIMGINDEGFSWKLEKGETFQTPETILTYSYEGFNELSHTFHKTIRKNVCDKKYIDMVRPVLINSWEAAYFDFDEEKIYGLAESAKELGVEMFVLDDGWFGKRNNDSCGLGDWFVNEDKLKGGLKKLVDRINTLGLKFGIWIEPEMISEDSDLYRAHPDWALTDPDRKPMVARDQLVIDMSRQDVRDYLFESISGLLNKANIEYIKWDFNRSVSNFYSKLLPPDRQGEVAHRFVLGTYELLDRLEKAFPKVMIEGCAGGGGRFDAGMLFYCPQIWCSDNTDPIARLSIQKGTSYGYPVSSMGSHVSVSPNHQTNRSTPFNTRGLVAMSGTFGYELDPGKLSEEEKKAIGKQIRDFHKYYELIQKGDYYRISEESFSNHYFAWEFVSEDKSEALMNIAAVNVEVNSAFPFIKFRGLKEDSFYRVEELGLKLTGGALMYGGLSLDILRGDYPALQLYIKEDK
ncbi:MAG: alpha-galactosidase [Lachnospiraceae bacterium]|nr:alpha-galactosidase [Lachnospiraceae bacterium]